MWLVVSLERLGRWSSISPWPWPQPTGLGPHRPHGEHARQEDPTDDQSEEKVLQTGAAFVGDDVEPAAALLGQNGRLVRSSWSDGVVSSTSRQ